MDRVAAADALACPGSGCTAGSHSPDSFHAAFCAADIGGGVAPDDAAERLWRRLRAMASAIAVPTSTLHLSLPVVIRSPVVRVGARPRSTQDLSDTGEHSLRSAASAVPLLMDWRIRRSASSTPFCSDAYMAKTRRQGCRPWCRAPSPSRPQASLVLGDVLVRGHVLFVALHRRPARAPRCAIGSSTGSADSPRTTRSATASACCS